MLFFAGLLALPVFYTHVLNFQEILRVGLVFIIFFAIYIFELVALARRRKFYYADSKIRESESRERLGVTLAMTAVFLTFQFDPAYSGHRTEIEVTRNNLFFWLNMNIIFVMSGLLAYSIYKRLGSIAHTLEAMIRSTKALDRVIVLVVFLVVIGGIPVRFALGSNPIGLNYAMTGAKVFGIVLLWITIRLGLSYPLRKGTQEKAGAASSGVLINALGLKRLYKWIMLILFLTIVLEARKVGALYAAYWDLNALPAETRESFVIEQSRKLLKQNRSLKVDWIERSALEKMAVAYQKIDSVKQSEAIIKDLQVYLSGNDAANRIKADIYYAAGNFEKAQAEYEQYMQKGFRDDGSIDNLAECYIRFRNIMGLIDLTRDYNYLPPEKEYTGEENILLGNALMEAGRLNIAERFYNTALNSNEDHSYIMYKLGRLKYEENNLPGAIEYFKNAIDEDSSFADAYYRLGVCHEDLGDSVNAYRLYNLTFDLLPNHYDAMVKLKKGFIFSDSL